MQGVMALKLDAAYRPIAVIEAVDALVMCMIGKAKAIEEELKNRRREEEVKKKKKNITKRRNLNPIERARIN